MKLNLCTLLKREIPEFGLTIPVFHFLEVTDKIHSKENNR